MKYYKWVGLVSSVLLVVSCFLPWTYYADLNKNFTGFFSEQNAYGKPGIFFSFFGIISFVLVFLDKIWAKRTHIFFAALNIGYLIKTYILFTSCYNAYCPEKKIGLYLVVLSSVILMAVSVFPNLKIISQQSVTGSE